MRLLTGLLLLAVLQGLAIRFTLDRYPAWTALAGLAGAAVLILVVRRALPQALAAFRWLKARLTWWHGLWLLLFLSDLVFRIRDLNTVQDAPLDFWAAYRMALVFCCGLLLAIRLLVGRGQWLRSLCTGLPMALAIFAGFSIFSTLWSVYPSWTLYKSCEYMIDLAVLAAIVAEARTVERFKTLLDWTWSWMALLLAAVWAGVAVWPTEALVHDRGMLGIQIEGVLPQVSANGVGELAAVLGIVSLTRLLVRKGARARTTFYGVIFAASMGTLFVSQTRSALVAFAAAVVLVLLFSRRLGVSAGFVLLLVLVLSQTTLADSFWIYFRRGQDREQFATLSGRTGWWTYAWHSFLERPFTGFGGYAGGRFVALAQAGEKTASSLHSTWLEILLGTGIIGVLPVLGALVGAWWVLIRALNSVARSLDRQLVLEALGVLAVVTVRSVFTAHLIWHPSLSFLAVLGFAEFVRRGTHAQHLAGGRTVVARAVRAGRARPEPARVA